MKNLCKLTSAVALLSSALTLATHASAQTWTRYKATGIGYAANTNPLKPGFEPYLADVTLSFSVLNNASDSSGEFFYVGNSFIVHNHLEDLAINSEAPGVIAATYQVRNHQSGIDSSFTINYADLDNTGGFPAAVANNRATGAFSFSYSNGFADQFYTVYGSFRQFFVVGEASGYESPSFQATAVPETTTWGMMIAGFGMMGAAMRTRRRSTKVTFA